MAKGAENTPEPRRHRSKFKLKSIHVDELLNAAGMSGFLSVLDPLPQNAPEHLERLADEALAGYQKDETLVPDRYRDAVQGSRLEKDVIGTPETGIPFSRQRRLQSPDRSPQIRAQTQIGIPETDVPVKGIPISGIPLQPSAFLRKPTIRQATLVQDGHSLGEQAVYQSLWDHAQPYDADSRVISIGYRTLSQLCHLTVNNCKANLLALARKLAIKELIGHGPTQSKTYQVFSYNSILRLRRQAGLTHYIKTRGVAFVDPESGEEVQKRGIPETGIPLYETGIPETGGAGTPVSDTPSLEHLVRQTPPASVPSSSSQPPSLRHTLEAIAGPVDDDALSRLLYACLTKCPDVTEHDVALGIQLKSSHILEGRVQNPIGFLLTAVPVLFDGEGLQRVRRWAQSREVRGVELEGDVKASLEALLKDAASTDQDRAFARQVLEELQHH